jgi:hypothetical protein
MNEFGGLRHGPNIAKRVSRSLCFEMQLFVAKHFDGVHVGGGLRLAMAKTPRANSSFQVMYIRFSRWGLHRFHCRAPRKTAFC